MAGYEIDEMKAEIREIDARRAVAKEKEEIEREERRRREQNLDTAGGGFSGGF